MVGGALVAADSMRQPGPCASNRAGIARQWAARLDPATTNHTTGSGASRPIGQDDTVMRALLGSVKCTTFSTCATRFFSALEKVNTSSLQVPRDGVELYAPQPSPWIPYFNDGDRSHEEANGYSDPDCLGGGLVRLSPLLPKNASGATLRTGGGTLLPARHGTLWRHRSSDHRPELERAARSAGSSHAGPRGLHAVTAHPRAVGRPTSSHGPSRARAQRAWPARSLAVDSSDTRAIAFGRRRGSHSARRASIGQARRGSTRGAPRRRAPQSPNSAHPCPLPGRFSATFRRPASNRARRVTRLEG